MAEIVPWVSASVAAVAVIVAISTYVITRWVEAKRARRALTIELWKMWRSKDLRRDQTDVYQSFRLMKKEAGIELSELTLAIQHSLGNVEHFLVEVAALKHRGLLEDILFKDLFADSLPPWQQLSARMSRQEHVEVGFEARIVNAYAILLDSSHKR